MPISIPPFTPTPIGPTSAEPFSTYVQGQPSARTPLTGTELVPIIQGGVTVHAPPGSFNAQAGAPVFYVSPTGNDGQSGTSPSKAWQTIGKVNASSFTPGTVILFQGGQTFSDATLVPQGGASGAPVTYGSYGTGLATISRTAVDGISWSNVSNVVIRDLIVTGSGGTTSKGVHGTYSVTSENVVLQNLTVSGFASSGISILASGSAILYGLQIIGCVTSNNTGSDTSSQQSGINVLGQYGAQTSGVYNFQNALIKGCISHDNPGTATSTASSPFQWSGSGITIAEGFNCTIEDCEAYNNGAANLLQDPVGIWYWDCSGSRIVNCSSHDNKHGCDGFDLDAGTLNCSIENCISYNNGGLGILSYAYNDGLLTGSDANFIFNCFVVNNNLLAVADAGEIWASAASPATVTRLNIHGNTLSVDNSPGAAITVAGDTAKVTATVIGNTIVSGISGTSCAVIRTGAAGTSIDFEGNTYWSQFSNPFKFNATSYGDLGSWAVAAGVEQTGLITSPLVQPLAKDPTTSNLVSGNWSMLKNTGTGLVAPWWNNAGTVQQIGRYKLTANTSFFIASTGNDSNPGTAGSPWLTTTHAAIYIADNIDLAGFTVTVNIGSGSFAGCGMRSTVGGGVVYWKGNGSANTTITGGPNDGFYNFGECFDSQVLLGTQMFFNKFKLVPNNAFAAAFAAYFPGNNFQIGDTFFDGALIDITIDFTGGTGGQKYAFTATEVGAVIGIVGVTHPGTINIIGGGANIFTIMAAQNGGFIFTQGQIGFSFSGSLTFASYGGSAQASAYGLVVIDTSSGTTFSGGTVTGPRFNCTNSGAIQGSATGALGANFFVGNAAGIVDASSSYDGFIGAISGSGLPTTTQFPDPGTGGLYKDTSGGGVYSVYNDAGTIKKVQLT